MKSRISFPSGTSTEQDSLSITGKAATLFLQHGALLLENVFSADMIRNLAEAFRTEYETISKRDLRKRDALVGDRRYMITVKIRKPFNDPALYANSLLMPVLEQLLTTHLRIASFGAVASWPGAEAQPIHLDHPPLFDESDWGDQMPPYAITVVIPLVDMDESMGPTAIWPGTHRSPDRLDRLKMLTQSPSFTDAEMPVTRLGDAYMMDYRVIHGGLPNNSDQIRPILYLVYSRPWFRDGFNFSTQPSVRISKKQRKKVPLRWQGLFRG